jgi:hypothetical protein
MKRTLLNTLGSIGVGGIVYGIGAAMATSVGASVVSVPVLAVSLGAGLLFFVGSESNW